MVYLGDWRERSESQGETTSRHIYPCLYSHQVKLRFKDVTGNYLVATRLMEVAFRFNFILYVSYAIKVTQTAKTQRFKTLEGAIEMYDPETKEVLFLL